MNSMEETSESKTTEVFLQESKVMEFILPLTTTVDSVHLYK